jgi:hypothetical protein
MERVEHGMNGEYDYGLQPVIAMQYLYVCVQGVLVTNLPIEPSAPQIPLVQDQPNVI